jgi:glycosyltransferase involved in cell wall biosynthesis
VLTLSESVAADVRSLGFDGPIEVTPHPAYDAPDRPPPVAASRAAFGLPPTGPVLLFFGLVRAYKGVDVLVEAMPRILAAHPDATLLVAGEWYADAAGTRARIEEMDLAERVRIDDRYVPSSELATVFAAADLVVQPYRSATQSGVLQLAASHGVPCVVTDVGGLAEPVRKHHAGVVGAPGDAAALAAGVLEALAPGRLDALGRGALSMADAHGWDPFCEALETLIHRTTTGAWTTTP